MPGFRTDNANLAPRCQHIKLNGDPCRCPAMHGETFCHFHDAIDSNRYTTSLPLVEDSTTLQFALMQVIRAVANKSMDYKAASLILYGLQIASSNIKRFEAERSPRDTPGSDQGATLAELLLKEFSEAAPEAVESARAQLARQQPDGY